MKKVISIRGIASEISILPDAQVHEILNNLKRIRKDKGFTQANIAKKMDISSVQYGNLENGRNQLSVWQLFSIIEIMDVSINDVFTFPEEIPDNIKKTIDDLRMDIKQKDNYIRLLEKETSPKES
jgi:transcriptional regulator with XRE-family HTH domain